MADGKYVFDNAAPETAGRFGALEEMFDENSFRQLSPFVLLGQSCLEVGAGSGSIAAWMSEMVGPTGRVLATDINPRFLEGLERPNLEVRLHDVTQDELPQNEFDLIHTRLVLVHLPQREQVVEKLLGALRPGGWLVLEEFESLTMTADRSRFPPEYLFKTLTAMWENMGARGANVSFGRSLFPLLRRLGMADVSSEGYVRMANGGSAGSRLMRANFMQTRDALIAAGRITAEEFQADIERLDDPEITWPSSVMWTVRGMKV